MTLATEGSEDELTDAQMIDTRGGDPWRREDRREMSSLYETVIVIP